MNSSDIPHGEECASNRRGSSPGCLYRIPRIHYSEKTMWNVEERFSPKAIESLAALGFAVGSTRGVVRVENMAAAPSSAKALTTSTR